MDVDNEDCVTDVCEYECVCEGERSAQFFELSEHPKDTLEMPITKPPIGLGTNPGLQYRVDDSHRHGNTGCTAGPRCWLSSVCWIHAWSSASSGFI